MKKKLILTITAYLVTLLISGTVQASEMEEILSQRDDYKSRVLTMKSLGESSEMLSLEASEGATVVNTWNISKTSADSVIATLYSDGTLAITGTGNMKNWSSSTSVSWNSKRNSIKTVNISEGVTSIGNYAFEACYSLSQINIPESVTSIGNYAFDSCSRLTKINIPESVTSIGQNAFFSCSGLSQITIPEGVTSIESHTFCHCSSLTQVNIPDSVTTISGYSFFDCSSLSSIAIPEGVTSIGANAFYECSALTSITIPSGVTSIGSYAFYKCTELESIEFEQGSQLTSISSSTFSGCSNLSNINIPKSVKSIGSYAFNNCTKLASIEFEQGSQLTSISSSTFSGCSNLSNINIPESVTGIGQYAFSGCSSLIEISIPEGVRSIRNYAFEGCSSLIKISIPSGVTSIENGVFYGCSSLIEISIPEGVRNIGNYAFKGCNNLTRIEVAEGNRYYSDEDGVLFNKEKTEIICYPGGKTNTEYIIAASITSIREFAFKGCSNLEKIKVAEGNENYSDAEGILFNKEKTEIICYPAGKTNTEYTIPDSVTSIGEGVFSGCSGLTSIEIPTSVTNMGNYAFEDCSNLKDVTTPLGFIAQFEYAENIIIQPGITEIGEYELCGMPFKNITIPEGVTEIKEYAFGECYNLENIKLPESLTKFGWGAFSFCPMLESITIPGGVERVEDWAFYGCENLKNVIIEEGVKEIGDSAFGECYSLINVSMPKTLEKIGPYAFYLTNLESVNIPLGVTTIQEYAFADCANLTSITIPNTVETIEVDVFVGSDNITIYCTSNSVAHTYADENELNYVLDDTVPEIEVQGNTDSWTNEDVTVTVEGKDSLVGLAKGAYSFDGGTTWQDIGEYTYKESANTQIKVRDAVGNILEYEVEIKIDKEKPSIESIEGIPENWSNKDVVVKILGEDNLSGLSEKPYSFDGGRTWQDVGEYTYTQSTNTQIQVKDNAGNIVEYEVEIKIDKNAPTIKVEGNLENWTRENVKVTVEAEDKDSGLAQMPYSFDGGGNWQETGEYTYIEHTKTQLQVKDIAGNIEVYDIEAKIDRTVPKVGTVEISTAEWTEKLELRVIGAEDNGAGLAQEAYSFDGGKTWQKENTKTFTENKEGLIIRVKDNIGNMSTYEKKIDIRNIIQVKEIAVKEKPEKTEYILGEEINIEGLIIEQIFNNGDIKELTEEYEYSPKVFEEEGTQEITLQYKDKTAVIEVKVEKVELTSEEYAVEEKIISNIQPGTTVKEIKERITTNANTIKLYNKEGHELKDEDVVTTKTKIKLNNIEEYSLVVRGDATGDGKSDIKDILQINKHRLNKAKLEGEYLKAADADGNNIADIKDILKINKYRLKKIDLL